VLHRRNEIVHARQILLTTPGSVGRYEAMVDAMKDEAAKAKTVMNDGLDKDTQYGPINNRMQLARVRASPSCLCYVSLELRFCSESSCINCRA
jgi:hypothetical protein